MLPEPPRLPLVGAMRAVRTVFSAPTRTGADQERTLIGSMGHRPGRSGKKEVVPSNLRLRLSASYCPFGLSASRIVGGPFGPFLSAARNHPVRYAAPLHPTRDHRPLFLGTRCPLKSSAL
jgi:hypothetical protein